MEFVSGGAGSRPEVVEDCGKVGRDDVGWRASHTNVFAELLNLGMEIQNKLILIDV